MLETFSMPTPVVREDSRALVPLPGAGESAKKGRGAEEGLSVVAELARCRVLDSSDAALAGAKASAPALLEYKLAEMEDVRIPARDGLELVAYLTRADTSKPTALGRRVPWAVPSGRRRSGVHASTAPPTTSFPRADINRAKK